MKKEKCCICGRELEVVTMANGHHYVRGNDPYPVKENGMCCDTCNAQYVIPARIKAIRERKQ